MVNKKEIISFLQEVKKGLKEDFESRYGFTDKKRKIDNMIKQFPNGVEIAILNIQEIKESKYSMLLKYDPNSLDSQLKYHGYHKINNQRELRKLITLLYGIKWPIKISDYIISDYYSYQNCFYIYVKNNETLSDMISMLFKFDIIHEIDRVFELSVEGVSDQIHSVKWEKMKKEYIKTMRLPSDKSFIIFDLPFEMALSKDRYKFEHRGKEGELRVFNMRAMYGDGRAPIMGLICSIPFSRIVIIYPFRKKDESDEIIMTSINIMNEIIEVYRIVTNHYFIPNISLNNIKEYEYYIHGKGQTVVAKIKDTYSPYFKYQDKLIKDDYSPLFSRYLKGAKNLPLQRRLISNSKRHFYYQNYQYAIFEAVLALEIAVSNLIREKYEKLELSRNQIDSYLNRTGIYVLISNIIPPLISKRKREKINKLRPMCIKAIQARNDIAHKGKKDFRTKEVANYIKAIESSIEILEN